MYVAAPASMRTALKPLPALTGLRFLAGFHVVLFHYLGRDGMPEWLANVLSSGPNSVTLFFVLSGFILAYSYLGAEPDATVSRRAFWVARFARVYPVYLLGLVLAAPVFVSKALQQQGVTGESLLTVVGIGTAVGGLFQAWVPAAACQWNCPGWSLSVEAFFYLVFPFAALPVLRMGPRRLLLSLGLSALVGLLLMGGWLYGLQVTSMPGSSVDPEAWKVVGAYNPLLRLPQFLCGVFLGRLFCLRQRASATFDRAMVAVGVVVVRQQVGHRVQRHAGEEGARRRRPQQRRREGDERERVQRVHGALPRRLEVGARPDLRLRLLPHERRDRPEHDDRQVGERGPGQHRQREAPPRVVAAAHQREVEEGVGGGVHRAAGARRNGG